jgi:carbon-monoxide dehydrogenase large subunit
VPSSTNPLGMRGASAGGITPGLAAAINAIVEAMAGFGIEHIELPATPERVWRAVASRDGSGNVCVLIERSRSAARGASCG